MVVGDLKESGGFHRELAERCGLPNLQPLARIGVGGHAHRSDQSDAVEREGAVRLVEPEGVGVGQRTTPGECQRVYPKTERGAGVGEGASARHLDGRVVPLRERPGKCRGTRGFEGAALQPHRSRDCSGAAQVQHALWQVEDDRTACDVGKGARSGERQRVRTDGEVVPGIRQSRACVRDRERGVVQGRDCAGDRRAATGFQYATQGEVAAESSAASQLEGGVVRHFRRAGKCVPAGNVQLAVRQNFKFADGPGGVDRQSPARTARHRHPHCLQGSGAVQPEQALHIVQHQRRGIVRKSKRPLPLECQFVIPNS